LSTRSLFSSRYDCIESYSIEELLQGYTAPQDLLGEEGLLKELKKRLPERALGAELSEHLGYERAIRPATVATANQSSEDADG